MEIILNKAYSSQYDNIEFPVYELSENRFLCIAYSMNHATHYVNIYSKEDFEEQGYQEGDEFDQEYFKDIESDIV